MNFLLLGVKSAEELTVFSNASAGFLASFFSSIAITPTELIKCKLQAMHKVKESTASGVTKVKYIGPVALTQQIWRTEGLKGLFRGLVPTLAREMPGYFFFFGGYEGKLNHICIQELNFGCFNKNITKNCFFTLLLLGVDKLVETAKFSCII